MVGMKKFTALLLLLAACEAGSSSTAATSTGAGGGDGGSSGDGGDGGAGPTTSTGEGAGSPAVSVGNGTTTGSGGEDPIAEVYGHSPTTLYRLDPETKAVTEVADFSGCDDDVIDIALDKDSTIYGTTTNRAGDDPVPTGGLWRIDKNTAACTLVARGEFPNSLSFVPAGTLDAGKEALVGYVNENYVRIDTVSGNITTVRADALPSGLVSSGDIVSVIDGPTLLTVKGTGCEDLDCVVAIDPATGEAMGNLGSAGYNDVFGVAFWAGSLYGFTRAGELFEFKQDDQGGITTTPIQVSSGLEFYGAGSTTAAPPTDIPN